MLAKVTTVDGAIAVVILMQCLTSLRIKLLFMDVEFLLSIITDDN